MHDNIEGRKNFNFLICNLFFVFLNSFLSIGLTGADVLVDVVDVIITRHEVSKPDCHQTDKAEVGSVQEGPVLPGGEDGASCQDVGEQQDDAGGDRDGGLLVVLHWDEATLRSQVVTWSSQVPSGEYFSIYRVSLKKVGLTFRASFELFRGFTRSVSHMKISTHNTLFITFILFKLGCMF